MERENMHKRKRKEKRKSRSKNFLFPKATSEEIGEGNENRFRNEQGKSQAIVAS